MTTPYIAHDWCGWNDQYGRYTHLPTCNTLVCQAYMNQQQWDQAQLNWLQQYQHQNLTIHNCTTGPYQQTPENLMGTVDNIIKRLQQKLSATTDTTKQYQQPKRQRRALNENTTTSLDEQRG